MTAAISGTVLESVGLLSHCLTPGFLLQTVTTTCAASWPRRRIQWYCQWGEWPETFNGLSV